ncbi:ORF6N domain-containing protein [Peredibacter starrii]|uniref:ORF6N domain-containing protein n=2 Tax=Peredibacter starrii TaxID=28202 RepID=A0AAX4HK58_9BACT|nr:ORF6N domain-containing protein [Peredibacter starrii]WPU63636.1 ORF6N domain-containing protein [Peredibacter starrii]
MEFHIEKIEAMIYTIRGQRVMMDSDLAKLYGVETKALNQAVKRNRERFPEDFLIEPNSSELASLRSQIVTLEGSSHENHFRHSPFLFTENGVAMLSSVLHSKEAIQVNITIMRAFTKLRSFLAMGSPLEKRVDKIQKETNQLFKIVFERLDHADNQMAAYEEAVTPKLPRIRKKIGLKN